jgi:Winged helix DNA-binding domain
VNRPSKPPRFTARDLRDLRLYAHRLRGPQAGGAVEAVRSQLASQAQNLNGALWSIGQRTVAASREDIVADLEAARMVQTWTMRGTLHLVAAQDVRWMLALLPPRVHAGMGKAWQETGLSVQVLETAREHLAAALSSAGTLTRKALQDALGGQGIDATGLRGSHIIRYLAETATIVIGVPDGKTQTFSLLDDRVPAAAPLERDEALQRLAVRYVAGHGPATDRDLAWWSGLTVSDARLAFKLAHEELQTINVDELTYWVDPALLDSGPLSRKPSRKPSRSDGHLLAGFDEYHIGYADRALILDDRYRPLVGPAKNGLFQPPVLIDGWIAGTWTAKATRRSAEITLTAFPDTPVDAVCLGAAVERHSAFLGVPATITT